MLDRLAKRLLAPVNTSVTSIMGIFNGVLGFWLLLPFSAISDRYSSFGIKEIIAVATLAIGICIIVGALQEKLSLLSWAALAGFIFWIATTGLALFVNWQAPGWIFTLMIACYHGFVALNIKVNNRNLPNKK
jgi:hypothetical protein